MSRLAKLLEAVLVAPRAAISCVPCTTMAPTFDDYSLDLAMGHRPLSAFDAVWLTPEFVGFADVNT